MCRFSAVEKDYLPCTTQTPLSKLRMRRIPPPPPNAIPPLSYFIFPPMFLFILTLVTFEPLNISVLFPLPYTAYTTLPRFLAFRSPFFHNMTDVSVEWGKSGCSGARYSTPKLPFNVMPACLLTPEIFSDVFRWKKKKTPRVIPRARHDSSELFQKVRNLIRKKTQK